MHRVKNISSIYDINDEMVAELKNLGAVFLVEEHNYDNSHAVSSIHFLDAERVEVAYLIPDMHNPSWGKLSGFNKIRREYPIRAGLEVREISWK